MEGKKGESLNKSKTEREKKRQSKKLCQMTKDMTVIWTFMFSHVGSKQDLSFQLSEPKNDVFSLSQFKISFCHLHLEESWLMLGMCAQDRTDGVRLYHHKCLFFLHEACGYYQDQVSGEEGGPQVEIQSWEDGPKVDGTSHPFQGLNSDKASYLGICTCRNRTQKR